MTEKLNGISGSMKSGKTDLLIIRAERLQIAKKNIIVFKPSIDNRWDENCIVTRFNNKCFPATPVKNPAEIIEHVVKQLESGIAIDEVLIDEVQLFDSNIVEVIQILLDLDIPVTYAGLATDFRGEPFGSMPTLLAISDSIKKPTAICEVCGDEATRTQRLINGKPANYNDPIILIGDNQYEARCTNHHTVPGKPKLNLK
jgi:thymidine kinase